MTFPAELRSQLIKILTTNKIHYTSGWSNYMETVNNPAAMVIEIDNEEALQLVIKAVKQLNSDRTPDDKITVRATSGWSDKNVSQCCILPWNKVQENTYDEAFSFSQVVGGRASADTAGTDIIIRFAKKFHNIHVIGPIKDPVVVNPNTPIHQLPSSLVEVSAGVQITELADYLRKKNLSLSTVSMIAWVTAVGLAGTAGHGTGRDEPAFSGLIESFKICDPDGNIREISRGDPDFETLRGGHSGLAGIVVSIKLRTVKAFNLRETIDLFPNTKEMAGKLSDVLKDNQYISIMGMPSYSCPETNKLVSKWQISKWNFTTDKPTKIEPAPYAPDMRSFAQEIQVRLGASVMDFLIDSGLKHLLPAFMLLSAAVVTGARGTKAKVDYENHITHPQVAFPKEMRDVSYLVPVKDAEAGQKLEAILQKMEKLLNKAGKKGEFPVTYAIYVRYFKGTNGGLSTSATGSEDERILAIDVVTHPDAPGVANFEQNVLAYFKEIGVTPRHHLGKNFPAGVAHYDQFLDADALTDLKKALERWYSAPGAQDGAARIAMSPYITPYLQEMLSLRPILNNMQSLKSVAIPMDPNRREHTDLECKEFLTKLHSEVNTWKVQNEESQAAKDLFLKACQMEMEVRNAKVSRVSMV